MRCALQEVRPSASAPNKRSRILNFFIDDLNFNGFMMCLQSKPFCGEVMLPCRCDEDTSFAMLRMRTAMDTDASSVRNVFQQRKRTFELRRTVDHNRISAFRNEIFCILQGVAQGEEVDVATFINAVQFATDESSVSRLTYYSKSVHTHERFL